MNQATTSRCAQCFAFSPNAKAVQCMQCGGPLLPLASPPQQPGYPQQMYQPQPGQPPQNPAYGQPQSSQQAPYPYPQQAQQAQHAPASPAYLQAPVHGAPPYAQHQQTQMPMPMQGGPPQHLGYGPPPNQQPQYATQPYPPNQPHSFGQMQQSSNGLQPFGGNMPVLPPPIYYPRGISAWGILTWIRVVFFVIVIIAAILGAIFGN